MRQLPITKCPRCQGTGMEPGKIQYCSRCRGTADYLPRGESETVAEAEIRIIHLYEDGYYLDAVNEQSAIG